jgi:hypothetical protein
MVETSSTSNGNCVTVTLNLTWLITNSGGRDSDKESIRATPILCSSRTVYVLNSGFTVRKRLCRFNALNFEVMKQLYYFKNSLFWSDDAFMLLLRFVKRVSQYNENLHGYPRIRQSELCPPLIMSNGKKIYVCCQIFKYSFERFFDGNMCVSQCRCCQLFLRILAIFCYGEIFEATSFF